MVSVCAFGMEDLDTPLKALFYKNLESIRQNRNRDSIPPGLVIKESDEIIGYDVKQKIVNTVLGDMYRYQGHYWKHIRKGEYDTLQHFFNALYAQELLFNALHQEGPVANNTVYAHIRRNDFPLYVYNGKSDTLIYPLHGKQEDRRCSRVWYQQTDYVNPTLYSCPSILTIEHSGTLVMQHDISSQDTKREIKSLALSDDGQHCACCIEDVGPNRSKNLFVKIIECNSMCDSVEKQKNNECKLIDLGPTTLAEVHDLQFVDNNTVSCLLIAPEKKAKKWVIMPGRKPLSYSCVIGCDNPCPLSLAQAYGFPGFYEALKSSKVVVKTTDQRLPVIAEVLKEMPIEIRRAIVHTLSLVDAHLRKKTLFIYGTLLSDQEKKAFTIAHTLKACGSSYLKIPANSDDNWSEEDIWFAAKYVRRWGQLNTKPPDVGPLLTHHAFKTLKLPPLIKKRLPIGYNRAIGELVADPTGKIAVNYCNNSFSNEYHSFLCSSFHKRYYSAAANQQDDAWFTKDHAQKFVDDNTLNNCSLHEDFYTLTLTFNNGTHLCTTTKFFNGSLFWRPVGIIQEGSGYWKK